MSVPFVLNKSRKIYYISTDVDGNVTDVNHLFQALARMLDAQDYKIEKFTTARGAKIVYAAAQRAKRIDWSVGVQILIRQPDQTLSWSSWEITHTGDSVILLGFDCSADGDISAKKMRQIQFMQSHIVRRWVANILGLSPLMETMDENGKKTVMKMIDEAVIELDAAIHHMTDFISGKTDR